MFIHYVTARCAFRRLLYFGIFAFFGVLAIVLFLRVDNGSKEVVRLRKTADGDTGNEIKHNSPRQTFIKENRDTARNVIYVLGGTQHSLSMKYRTAANLYQKGGIEEILIATSEGITVYDKNIGRNLTNDEWTVKQFTRQRVEPEAISFIKMKDGFFGTLLEARTLREICINKGINKLLLVCSEYHSKRVLYVFSTILENTGVGIEICTANEQIGFSNLLIEHVKLIFYKYALIPLELWLRNLS